MRLGLIGWPLGHSRSPEIHRHLTGTDYRLIPLKKEELEDFLKEKEFDGLNVTIPYKQEVIPYLDVLDVSAVKTGAVNTIVNREGKLTGYNTDYIALKEMILNAGMDLSDSLTAVLGSGGASKAASAAVKELGGTPVIVSRFEKEGTITYEQLYQKQNEFSWLINTTPVGLSGREDEAPVEIQKFTALNGVIDVIANPLRTRLMFEAGMHGIKAIGGFEMLVRQAFYAEEYFLDRKLDPALIDACLTKMYSTDRNLVLIGMPTCGKSTASKMLSEKTGMPLVDMDREIEKKLGTSIKQCFEEHGEAYFRKLECETAEEISKTGGHIISCGGGVIKTEETMRHLSRNGLIIWLKRDLERLYPTPERPLSLTKEALDQLYTERLPLYERYADLAIDNNGEIEKTADCILVQAAGGKKTI